VADQRRSTILSIVLVLVVFGGGVFLATRLLLDRQIPVISGGRVAVVPLVEVIGPSAERKFVRNLREFERSDAVRAFVLEIRSPGGTVGASQSIYSAIRALREDDDRPVIAWIGDVGASGGYYAALGADSIFALPGSITGSIGVIMEFPNAQELMSKVGLELQVVKSGPYKDIGSPARPLSEDERAVLQGVVDDVYTQFVDAVTENRPLSDDEARALADGRIYSGEQAADLELLDGLATLSEVIDIAGELAGLGKDPQTVRPRERRVGLLDLLSGISESRLREWFGGLLPETSTPRLLYQWMP
jgi:protease-4